MKSVQKIIPANQPLHKTGNLPALNKMNLPMVHSTNGTKVYQPSQIKAAMKKGK
jgi:hypothetical protein